MSASPSVLIVGGGLSGLAVADRLHREQIPFTLLEARDRLGGRILSRRSEAGGDYDLGPAWIWPHNTRMRALVAELGLTLFPQQSRGRLVFQDGGGSVRRDLDFAMMGDALRVAGGLGAVTQAMAGRLPQAALRSGHVVEALEAGRDGVSVRGLAQGGPFALDGTHVVLALPPRLLSQTISILPDPGLEALAGLAATPTWMAGQAKLVAIYDRPFWREDGFSGDAISHVGPLVEIHDASPADAPQGALFGFVAPGTNRSLELLRDAAVAQLALLFGPRAAKPLDVLFKYWVDDRLTATDLDLDVPHEHPAYGYPSALRTDPLKRLIMAGSESADIEGGFLEGALVAAEAAVDRVLA